MVRMFGEVLEEDKARAYNAYVMGWNYRANVIQATFTLSQLKRLDEYTKIRQERAERLSRSLEQIKGVIPPHVPKDRTHAYHAYRIRFDPAVLGIDMERGRFRVAVQRILNAEGVPAGEYQNTPIPGQGVFQVKEGYGKGCPWTCPHANEVEYRVEDYPETLKVIEDSIILGQIKNHANDEETIDYYIEAFNKVFANVEEVVGYAEKMEDYSLPWKKAVRRW